MRFMHLADLHIGKRVNEFSMLPDQRYILAQITQLAIDRKAEAVVIAGDVYDKTVPTTDALGVLEKFLTTLSNSGIPTIIIAGNHDSAERLGFGAALFKAAGIYISHAFSATPQVVRLHDEHGPVDFHLLPFVKPVYVRAAYPDEQILNYEEAVHVAVDHMELDSQARSVLVAHQFVTNNGLVPKVIGAPAGAVVGGVDNVDASLFDAFNYVALGHIHVSQWIRRPEVRYCGTPLKYSFSDNTSCKTVTFVNINAQGDVAVEEVPLVPIRRMRKVKGLFAQLKMAAEQEDALAREDYMHITLLDDSLMDAMVKVREFYPNAMVLEFQRVQTVGGGATATRIEAPNKTPLQLFEGFFSEQTGEEFLPEEAELFNQAVLAVEKV